MLVTHATCFIAGVIFGMLIVNLIFTVTSINMQIRKNYLDEYRKRIRT